MYADSAYVGSRVAERIAVMQAKARIVKRRGRGKELTQATKKKNRQIARHRARVEHIFGSMVNELKLTGIRCIGIVRARARIGLINLVYNMKHSMCNDQILSDCHSHCHYVNENIIMRVLPVLRGALNYFL